MHQHDYTYYGSISIIIISKHIYQHDQHDLTSIIIIISSSISAAA
jgi:hypothetical protein